MRELASHLATAVFVVDPSGELVFYNEPAELLLGTRFDETGPMPMDDWSSVFEPTDEQGRSLAAGAACPLVDRRGAGPPGARPLLDPGAGRRAAAARGDGHPAPRAVGAASSAPPRSSGRRRMRVTFWGTRGSLATPGVETVRYGGNTSCVEVRNEAGHVPRARRRHRHPAGSAAPRSPRHAAGRRPAHPPPHGPHPGARLLRLPVPRGLRGPHLGPGVDHHATADPAQPLPVAAALPGAAARPAVRAHAPRRTPRSLRDPGLRRALRRWCRHPAPTVGYRLEADGAASLAYLSDHEPALGVRDFPGPPEWTLGVRPRRAAPTC